MVFRFAALVAFVCVAGAAILGAMAVWHYDVKRRWVRWTVSTLAIGLGAAATVLFFAASHVVRVHSDMTTSEALLVGSVKETLGGRDVELSSHGSSATIIVNESDRTLELHAIVYGEMMYVPTDTTVGPTSVFDLDAKLEYVGPDHEPPREISSKTDREIRYWLTW